MKKTRFTATMAALAVAFGTEAEMFDLTARRGKSLPSYYPKRTESESAARLAAAEEKRKRRAEKMKAHNDRVEGRDAALSRRVPSHDGLEGNGT